MATLKQTVARRASGRPAGRKGRDTRDRIIAAARAILVDEGYDRFVVRRVSARAGVQPGNLQYYFGNKKELLRAVLAPELARYHDVYADVAAGHDTAPATVRAVVAFLLEEIQRKSTCNIWYTVWALAPQDPEIAALMDEWYQQYLGVLQRLVLGANPSLSATQAGHVACLLTAVMDGLTNQIGYGKSAHRIHRGLRRALTDLFVRLVAEPQPRRPAPTRRAHPDPAS